MPAKIWYIDPTLAPGTSEPTWVGPYGTGHRVAAWSQITKTADNWYFGRGGVVGAYNSFWDVTQAGVKIGSYGDGRHIMDFTNATLQGSGTKCPFRLRAADFVMECVHMKGATTEQYNIAVSDSGMMGLTLVGNKLQGPGAAATETQSALINIIAGATPGNWMMLSNELWDANSGMYVGEDCDKFGLFVSNRIRALTGANPGNSDGITFGGSTGGTQRLTGGYRIRIINNEISGFYDHPLDFVGWAGVWVEGNRIYNTDITGPGVGGVNSNTAGMILGGASGSGYHLICRNDITMVLPPGMTYTNVPAMYSRGGSGCLVVANRLVGQGGGFRNNTAGTAGTGNLRGINNTLINNTLVATGAGSQDYPLYQEEGEFLTLENNVLICANSTRQAISQLNQTYSSILLKNNVTNGNAWRTAGSGGTANIDTSNLINQAVPVGPEYFPTASLQGSGLLKARKWADIYGVQLPDNLVGGVAPSARTSATGTVTRKWRKGFQKRVVAPASNNRFPFNGAGTYLVTLGPSTALSLFLTSFPTGATVTVYNNSEPAAPVALSTVTAATTETDKTIMIGTPGQGFECTTSITLVVTGAAVGVLNWK